LDKPIELREEGVPLQDIALTAEDVIELYGGEISERGASSLHFSLPQRRGVAAAGGVACSLRWNGGAEGTVTLTTDRNLGPGRFQRVLLLVVGVTGAMLWMLWPFFPRMGELAWIGGAVAFATWFITARTTTSGMAADLLQRLVGAQRDMAATDDR
jgi:hypothetical protein